MKTSAESGKHGIERLTLIADGYSDQRLLYAILNVLSRLKGFRITTNTVSLKGEKRKGESAFPK
jgi:hypothetical protein